MIGLMLKASLTYFGIIFGVGFVFGMIRVPFLVPAIGERYAELVELPFMLAAVFGAARWVVRRFGIGSKVVLALFLGILSASLLLLIEFSVVLWIRGVSLSEFLESRDPVAATAYYIAAAIFALMPAALVLMSKRLQR